MKLEKLNEQIRSGLLAPVYFIYGEETHIIDSKIEQIKAKIIAPEFESFNFMKFEGKGVNAAAIEEAVDKYPQMSERTMILVSDCGIFSNATTSEFKRLKKIVAELPQYVCLVFREDGFDPKKEKNLAFIEEKGGVIRCEKMDRRQLQAWLNNRFSESGIQILAEDARYMVDICGTSLANLSNEADKLELYIGKSKHNISRSDIDACVQKDTELRVYDILDLIKRKDLTNAQLELKQLKERNESAMRILLIMTGNIADLLLCRQLSAERLSAEQLRQYFEYPKPPFVIKKLIEESRRYSEAGLLKLFKTAVEYNIGIVSGRIDDWTAVELLTAAMAQS